MSASDLTMKPEAHEERKKMINIFLTIDELYMDRNLFLDFIIF